jgi:hypothetical protein
LGRKLKLQSRIIQNYIYRFHYEVNVLAEIWKSPENPQRSAEHSFNTPNLQRPILSTFYTEINILFFNMNMES